MSEKIELIKGAVESANLPSHSKNDTSNMGYFIGEALENDEKINCIMATTKPEITILVGFVGYGKTSFIASCYHLLLTEGKVGDYVFYDSDTLTGLEFEEFVKELFEYLGFSSSLTSQSGDNGIDVVAKHKHYSIGIQTKLYYNHNVNNKAVQEAYSGKSYYKLDYAFVITNWKLSIPALNLAKSLNVIVIDRQKLQKIINNTRRENIGYINQLINIAQVNND